MQRCSNCGAAVRPGAKFCTSCGTRLNLDQAPTPSTGTTWGTSATTDETLVATPAVTPEPEERAETTDTMAATDTDAAGSIVSEPATEAGTGAAQGADAITGSPWRAQTTDAVTEREARDAETTETASTTEPAPSSASTSWTWGQRSPSTPEPEATADAERTDATTTPPKETSWTSRWPSMGGAEEPTTGATEATEDESPADPFADALEAEPTTPETTETEETGASTTENAPSTAWIWGQPVAEETDAVTESETIVPAAATNNEDASAALDAVPEVERVTVADATAPAGEAVVTGDDSARQRAAALLDELRTLLPQIGGSGAVAVTEATSAAGGGVADELSRARDEAGEFSGLRRTLESARDYPRDVDTMLDLVSRADRLLALLDSHEALRRAVDDAITQLRRP
jgi:hypothetical protein